MLGSWSWIRGKRQEKANISGDLKTLFLFPLSAHNPCVYNDGCDMPASPTVLWAHHIFATDAVRLRWLHGLMGMGCSCFREDVQMPLAAPAHGTSKSTNKVR